MRGPAWPKASTRASALVSASTSGEKSSPLSFPPSRTSSAPSKLLMADRAAATLVALESLTHRTPFASATFSVRCGRAVASASPRRMDPVEAPASPAAVAAAKAFSRLWAPGRAMSSVWPKGSTTPDRSNVSTSPSR